MSPTTSGKAAAPRGKRRTARGAGAPPRRPAAPPRGVAGNAALLAALPEPRRSQLARIDRFIRETVPELAPSPLLGMLGYGPFHYRYASGREGDTCKVALSSRARYISLYVCAADARGHVAERFRDRLPAADIGKGCVRFTRFEDLDPDAVRDLLRLAARTGYGE
jgi:hypothetical protein